MKRILRILFIATILAILILLFKLYNYMHYNTFYYNNVPTLSSNKQEISQNIYLYNKTYSKHTTELDLSNDNVDSSILLELSKFPLLEKVTIGNQIIPQNLQKDLEKKYPNIKFYWKVKILNKTVKNTTKKLDLSNSIIKDINTFKSSLSLLHDLKYLDMSDCNLSNKKLAKLRKEIPNVKIVWRIYLGKWSLKTDAVSFSVLITRFDYRRMKSSDIEVLKYCTDLHALDLGHQSITDISVIGEYLPNLRLLILADNRISDISPLKKLKHLHYLELFMNNIRDISPLKHCKELVDLNLAHIGPLYDFSPLLKNKFPLLERLWIENSGGTAKYYPLLKSKYPNVRIVHTGYGSTHSGWRTHPRYYAMIDMFYKRNYISDLFTKYDNKVK